MGRRSSSNRRSSNVLTELGRGVVTPHPTAKRTVSLPRLAKTVDLRVFEDRRAFHPDPLIRPAVALPRKASILKVGPHVGRNVSRSDPFRSSLREPPAHYWPSAQISFADPKRVVLCVRRKRRREIMHALGVAGRGGVGRGRKRHTNEFSEIGC